jgi:hypothetical protein
MAALIALLISLLGYGTPSDFEDWSEDQLRAEIEALEGNGGTQGDGRGNDDWDTPYNPNDDNSGSDGGNSTPPPENDDDY